MFVDIEDFKSAIAVENMLTPYKKGRLSSDKKSRLPKEPITPEVCMQVLQSTNYARNIKDMLVCIADLPPSEQAQFKDVVLATFTQREQPQAVYDVGKYLALNSGYQKEFDEKNEIKEGDFLLSSPQLTYGLMTAHYKMPQQDLKKYQKLICLHEEGVTLASIKNLPPLVDISRCLNVEMYRCDLAHLRELRLKEGMELNLNGVRNIPEFLDVSCCAAVDFGNVDLTPLTQLKFRKGAEVVFENAENLPPNLDFSDCSLVNLNYCDLQDVKNLKFARDAEVYLDGAFNYCGDLDFSTCSELSLDDFDLENVGCMRFKNEKQLDDSGLQISDDWQGLVIFANKSAQTKTILKITAKSKEGW